MDDLCEYLVDEGHRIYVLAYQPLATPIRGKGLEKKGDLEIHRFGWISGNHFSEFEKFPPVFNFLYLTPYLFLRTFYFLFSKRDEVDIIHAFGLNAAFIARWVKIIFKKKIIMSTEALYEYKKGTIFSAVCSWVLRGFDGILAQSEASKEEMVGIGVHRKRIKIFSHWVNQNKFKPGDKKEFKKKLGWEDKFTVLYLGRLISQKGIRVFLEVIEKTKENIAFKVIGDDGPELPAVEAAEKKLVNLEYVGRVPYQKLPPYYTAADVLLYPALYKEDMSRAILESLSCGTPVINTNNGSGIYALDDSVAIIIRPDTGKIAEKLKFLYEHPKRLNIMSKNCRKFAQKFGPRLAEVITNCYKELL